MLLIELVDDNEEIISVYANHLKRKCSCRKSALWSERVRAPVPFESLSFMIFLAPYTCVRHFCFLSPKNISKAANSKMVASVESLFLVSKSVSCVSKLVKVFVNKSFATNELLPSV